MRNAVATYGLALAVLAAATLARWLLDPFLGDHLPYVTYFIAVAVIAWLTTTPVSVGSLIFGWLITDYIFVPPHGEFIIYSHDPKYIVGTFTYFAVAATSTFVAHRMRQAQRRARLAAEQVQERQTFIASIVGSITDAFYVLDKGWRFVFVNEEMVGRLGKPRDQIVGGHVWEMFPAAVGNQAHIHLHRAMAERVVIEYEVFYEPWRRWFLDKAYPTDDGGLAVYSREVTEQKRKDVQVKKSQDTFYHLVERAPFGIYIVDSAFRISHMNAGSQTGAFRNVRPVIGRDFAEAMRILWPESVAQEIITVFRHSLETGEPYYSADFTNPRDDIGAVESYDWQLHRIALPDGQYGVICYYYDSTRLKQAEQALRDADRRKNEFLATLAHELRNPLAPIRNAIQILLMKGPPVPELQRCREVIDRQARHMARLLDDLFDVSRITHNKLELRSERIELAAVVHSAIEASRPLIDTGGQELTVILPPEPVYLNADSVRLAQVISNLLNNAAKYSETGGHIRLTCERQGSDVLVSVKDGGMGIAVEMLPRVFDIFSQAKRVLEPAQSGLGIGLSLVKGLVELHGGSITARSDGLGMGSEFIVRLPVVIDQPPTEEPAEEIMPSGKRRILVVDDNRDNAESLAMLLRLTENETHIAYDGEEAVEAAANLQPDLILLDIGLPKLNGYDACRRIREKQWAKNIIVIALTGWGQEDDRRKSAAAGFNGHLVKPVDHAELMKLLASLSPEVESQLTKR